MSGNSGSDTAGEGGIPDAGGAGGSSGDGDAGGDDAGATGEGGRSQAGAAGEENGGAGDRAGNSAGGTGGTGGSAGTGGSGGSDTSDCVEITLTDFYPSNEGWPEQSGETAGFFSLGALTLSGSVSIEYRLGDGRGRGTGVITLGDGGQDDYATCSHCVVAASSGRVYIATSGTLFLDNDSDQGHGYPQGALLNVTLREATIDGVSRETALVPQGTCLYLESQKVDIDPVGTWTECPPEYQEDEDCDCGCGALDSACASAADSACDYCFCPRDYGDCANSPVNASNNAVCSSG
ncbi:MAG TPA: hypothetical protein VGK41_00005 [Solirubrobacterales bacterium]